VTKVLIPLLQQFLSILYDQSLKLVDFLTWEPFAVLQSNGREPELGREPLAPDMHVWWFQVVT
jgi:hypothetical protein